MHGTSLLSTPGKFEPVLLPKVSKNDDKEHCFLKFEKKLGKFEFNLFYKIYFRCWFHWQPRNFGIPENQLVLLITPRWLTLLCECSSHVFTNHELYCFLWQYGFYDKVRRSTQNLKKSSSWFWSLLSKCTNHEKDCTNFCVLLR